jgi:adenylyl-sulfate kinase
VESILHERGVHCERLDGDVVRQSLTRDLGFSKEDRDKNIERVTFVAKVLTRNDVVVLSAFISPYRAQRENARREIGEFLEVFVRAPLDTLVARDLKGLYKKALAGELQGFTGVNDPYEEPESPALVIDTDAESAEESADRVIALLEERGYIAAAGATSTHKRGQRAQVPGPSAPHGGVLIDRELTGAQRDEALARARSLPKMKPTSARSPTSR